MWSHHLSDISACRHCTGCACQVLSADDAEATQNHMDELYGAPQFQQYQPHGYFFSRVPKAQFVPEDDMVPSVIPVSSHTTLLKSVPKMVRSEKESAQSVQNCKSASADLQLRKISNRYLEF